MKILQAIGFCIGIVLAGSTGSDMVSFGWVNLLGLSIVGATAATMKKTQTNKK